MQLRASPSVFGKTHCFFLKILRVFTWCSRSSKIFFGSKVTAIFNLQMLRTVFPQSLRHLKPQKFKSTLKVTPRNLFFIGISRLAPELWANFDGKFSTLMGCSVKKKCFQKKIDRTKKYYVDPKNKKSTLEVWHINPGTLYI